MFWCLTPAGGESIAVGEKGHFSKSQSHILHNKERSLAQSARLNTQEDRNKRDL